MGTKNLLSAEIGPLAHTMSGSDQIFISNTIPGGAGLDYVIYRAKAGTNSYHIKYLDIDGFDDGYEPYWVGIHNIGSTQGETVSVTAKSLNRLNGEVGHDLTKNTGTGIATPATYATYVDIAHGDVVWGKFTEVSIWITSSSLYIDRVRLIRGINNGS